MHKRQQIRDRIEAVLTGLSTTESNVFTSRIRRIDDSTLPSLNIMMMDEDVNDEFISKGYSAQVIANVAIECAVKVNNSFDDTLDAILEEVQAAMALERGTDGELTEHCDYFYYAGLSDVEYEGGELDMGIQVINYIVAYQQQV